MEKTIETIKNIITKTKLEGTEKQINFLNTLKEKAIVSIDAELNLQVEENDFDEFFGCWTGADEPENDCWTKDKGIAFINNKMANIDSAIKFLKSIS